MAAFVCSSCTAPLEPEDVEGDLVRCRYCRAVAPSPFPKRRVLLRVDPREPGLSGWNPAANQVSAPTGDPPEVVVRADEIPNKWVHALTSQGVFDDFEARFAFRLLWGDLTTTHVTLLFRQSAAGYYAASVSTAGTFQLTGGHGTTPIALTGWARSDALRAQPGELNEMVLRVEGDRILLALNGQTAASVRDATHRQGSFAIASMSKVACAYAIRRFEMIALDGPAVIAAAPAAVGAVRSPLPGAAGARAVRIDSCGEDKIAVIKAIRLLTELGLKESKDVADSVPRNVGEGLTPDEADRWARALAAAGARVTVV